MKINGVNVKTCRHTTVGININYYIISRVSSYQSHLSVPYLSFILDFKKKPNICCVVLSDCSEVSVTDLIWFSAPLPLLSASQGNQLITVTWIRWVSLVTPGAHTLLVPGPVVVDHVSWWTVAVEVSVRSVVIRPSSSLFLEFYLR